MLIGLNFGHKVSFETISTIFGSFNFFIFRETESELLIQVFPGPAVEVSSYAVLEKYNEKQDFPQRLHFAEGDTVTVKLDSLKV